jgi:DNA modification methylase
MTKPYYEHQGISIYHGDCREILPALPQVDLILTDPPYGINWVGHPKSDIEYLPIENDYTEMNLGFLFEHPCEDKVIFGANCFPNQLPHRGRWLVWDKRVNPKCDAMLGSPVELAWTSRTSGFNWICRVMHGGVVNNDGGKRVHPTQKPVQLMEFVLNKYPEARLVLDPFMGSGTTLIAAKELSRRAIGIEINEAYCELAAKRLSQDILPF